MFPAQIYGMFVRDTECAYRCWGRGSPVGHKQKQRACARECWEYPFEELAPHFLHEHRDHEVSLSLGKEGGISPHGW